MSLRKGSVNFHLFKDQNKGLIKITVKFKGVLPALVKISLKFQTPGWKSLCSVFLAFYDKEEKEACSREVFEIVILKASTSHNIVSPFVCMG